MSALAVRAHGLVVPGEITGPSTIMIDDGVVTAILAGHPPVTCEVFGDGSDVVVPGLIDIHTHGAVGVQVIDGDVDGLHRFGAFLAAHGVTSYLATIGGSDASIMAGLDAVRELMSQPAGSPGATCLGVHLEGPFISCCCPGAFDPASIVAPDLPTFERYLERSGGTLRHITLAPEVDGQLAVIAAARRAGVTCAAGHSAATETEMAIAVERGVSVVTHMFNAMPQFHHRHPGIVGAGLTDWRLTTELIADGVHVSPGAVDLLHRMKTPSGVALISDSIAAAGLPDGEYDFEEQHIIVTDGEARLADGRLAGSTLTLDVAVRNFADFAGIAWEQALRSASATPAGVLGLGDRKGRIDVGCDADLVGFSAAHEVRWTIAAGRIVFDAEWER